MSPFHPGEVQLQAHYGVQDRLAKLGGRFIRPLMPEQHRTFYAQLPFLVAGAVDPAGDVWATLLAGPPGFASAPDPEHLDISVSLHPDDPAAAGLRDGDAVGLLGIELETRRRNRVNGHLSATATGLRVTVEHSFGNCPKYIHRRPFSPAPAKDTPPARVYAGLPEAARATISAADTFFVASAVDLEHGRQIDASHRGGPPGFVHVGEDGTLTVPDYAGNRFFNTLGNLLMNPRAGLLFVDFATGGLLQVTGAAAVLIDDPRAAAHPGAQRLWQLTPTRAVVRPGVLDVARGR